jgi:multidrug efflux pump subunit AcrA (membrane-fusion protein)
MYYDDLRGIRGAEVAFTSLSDRRYSLELSALVPEIVAGSRSLVVKLHIPDDLPELTVVDGMLADVWLAFAGANAATMVPKDAVVQRQEKRLVVMLDMHNQTRVVPVLTGKSSGPWVEVRGDVTAGERVIVRGNERLDGGLTVNATLLDYPSP